MKVSIIGGGGLVGSSAAYALQCGGIVSHVCLIDAKAFNAPGGRMPTTRPISLARGRCSCAVANTAAKQSKPIALLNRCRSMTEV